MKRLSLVMALLAFCFSVQAQLIWDGDASQGTGIFKLAGTGNVESPSTLTAVDDAQRGRIWRYHKPSGSNRCENHGIRVNGSGYTFQNGQTYYLGWSTKLTNNSDNNAIFQWKSYDNHIQNFPVVLKLINGRISCLQRQPGPVETIIWSAPFSANTWYHVVLGLHLSDATRGGWVEVYFNGVQQTFNNGTQRYACRTFDSHNCPKWGIYGRSDLTITNFIDDLKVGRTYNDVKMPGTPTAPSAPSGLTATAASSSQINLSWTDNSNNETQFRIERSTNGGTTWTFLANAPTNATSYSNTGLTAATTYHYRVRAENAAGNSAFSNTANATTPGTSPSAPSGLTATTISSSQINLAWIDNSNNETSFRLEISSDAGATWSFLANIAANVTGFSSTGLTASTTYHYRVRAENATGNSAFSNTASATTSSGTTLQNVALNKPVTASSSDTNVPANAVDGSTATRWSASPWPQWLEVDLGDVYDISRTEVVCYLDRAYQFTVEARTTPTGSVTQVVNRSSNTTPGTISSPIVDTFGPVNARYVRINVTGASGYAGPWASIIEFRVFGVPATTEPPSDIYLEAESGTLVAPMQVFLGSTAFGGQYIAVAAGNNSQTAPPAGRATYNFSVATAGTYKVWGRVVAPTTGDDSFWVRMDGGAWINWNEIALGVAWHWDEVHDAANANTVMTYSLAAGSHTLDVAYREDGTQLDRLLITNNLAMDPNASSSSAARTSSSSQPAESIVIADNIPLDESNVDYFPNPTSNKVTIRYKVKKEGNVTLSIYNTVDNETQVVLNKRLPAGIHQTSCDVSSLPAGIHVLRLVSSGKLTTKKLIKRNP